MKKLAVIFVLLSLVGCRWKQENKNALFYGVEFDVQNISTNKTTLNTKAEVDGDGTRVYFLTTSVKNLDETTSVRRLCGFENQDYRAMQTILRRANNGVSIVVRPAQAGRSDIFLSIDSSENIATKTSNELLDDSNTLIVIRNVDVNDQNDAKKSLCEMNLPNESIPQAQ